MDPVDFTTWMQQQGMDPSQLSQEELSSWYPKWQATQPGSSTTTPAPTAAQPYQDINYWQNKGYGTNDMFDANGQMNPGWSRTANGYDFTQPPPTSNTHTGGGPAIPSGTIGDLLKPFGVPQPSYVGPNIGNAPSFPTLPQFNEPTLAQAEQQPGYAFAKDQMLKGVENSAAARGLTNTGGTLQDIAGNLSGFAEQNYQATRANSLEDYQNNLWSQYLAPYQAAQSNWQTTTGIAPTIAANQNNFNRGTWQDQYAAWRNRNNDSFNQLYGLATLGSGLQ